ncbi:MAG TPA: PilN domain-containing protein [Acidobacteriaceae bacterium]
MRISINLATRPFVELRPLFARLRLAMAALAVTAIALGIGLHYMNARARTAEAQMDALKSQTAALQTERQRNEARMMQPQNRAVLDRSKFLNTLFASKSFSWTSVMMDLERLLPAGVQVTNIEPAVTPEREVNIRLRVSGDRERAVELVRNLERSQRFQSSRLTNETAQTEDRTRLMPVAQGAPGGVEFEISSRYVPLSGQTQGPDQKAAQKDKGSEKPASSNHKPAAKKAAAPGVAK